MSGSSQLCCVVVLLTITGSILTVLWSIFCRFFDHPSSCPVIYVVIRLILLSFLLPVSYLGLRTVLVNVITGETVSVFFYTSEVMQQVSDVCLMIWLLGACGAFFVYLLYLYQVRQRKATIRKQMCQDAVLQECMEKAKRAAHVKMPVSLYWGEENSSAFTGGIFRKYVFLPKMDVYSIEEYEMMLLHELTHIRYRDIVWSYIAIVTSILNWFNPFFWYLHRLHNRWCEIHCDYIVAGLVEDDKVYGALLWKAANINTKRQNRPALLFMSRKKLVVERMERMKNYKKQKKQTKRKLAVMALAMAAFIGLSSVSAYGATRGVLQAQKAWYLATMEVQEEMTERGANTGEEIELSAEDLAGLTIVEEESGIGAYTSKNMDWTVENDGVHISGRFSASSGGTIKISIAITPDDKTICAGIIEPDGTWRGVYGSGDITHTFSLDQTGNYQTFVLNRSGVEITTHGFYRY